jgi:hypothetical protein
MDWQPGALDLTYHGRIRSKDTGSVSDSKRAVGSRSNGLTTNPNPKPPEIHRRQARAAAALWQWTERVQEGQGGMAQLPACSRRRDGVDGEVTEDGVDDGDWNGSPEFLLRTVGSG